MIPFRGKNLEMAYFENDVEVGVALAKIPDPRGNTEMVPPCCQIVASDDQFEILNFAFSDAMVAL